MCFIWENHPTTASQAAAFALKEFQWKKNTTYTVIKRLIQKEFLQRQEPGFFIIPLVEKTTNATTGYVLFARKKI